MEDSRSKLFPTCQNFDAIEEGNGVNSYRALATEVSSSDGLALLGLLAAILLMEDILSAWIVDCRDEVEVRSSNSRCK